MLPLVAIGIAAALVAAAAVYVSRVRADATKARGDLDASDAARKTAEESLAEWRSRAARAEAENSTLKQANARLEAAADADHDPAAVAARLRALGAAPGGT